MVRTLNRPARRVLAAVLALTAGIALAACSPPHTAPVAATHSAEHPTRSAVAPSAIWRPKPSLTWQWQLSGTVDTSVDAQVFDIDAADNSAAVVGTLHAAGRKVICYVNTGAFENFRDDAGRFPAVVLGSPNGWPGERWLDVRQLNTLRPIMKARFDQCASKGFDAIEADNVDGYTNDSGFPLTAADQLDYNRMLAALAHADNLAIGLKNDLAQVPELLPVFDFAVNEQCAEYDECGKLVPFISAGKAVFHVEYSLRLPEFCPRTTAMGFSSMRKNTALDAPRWPCPSNTGSSNLTGARWRL